MVTNVTIMKRMIIYKKKMMIIEIQNIAKWGGYKDGKLKDLSYYRS